MEIYNIKSISAVSVDSNGALITNIDTVSNIIEGYFSVFGNVDSDGDMIMPGAFTKTIKENARRIKHLWQHDPRFPLASPEISQDSYGLKFKSVISDTSIGRDVIRWYADGVIDEHSIGFRTIKAQKMSNYTELRELQLWEGSSVTWGANEMAIGGPVKSMTKDDIVKRMDTIYKALRHGKYETEEMFILLDIQHQQLKQQVANLELAEQKSQEDYSGQQPNDNEQIMLSIKNSLNNLTKTFNA